MGVDYYALKKRVESKDSESALQAEVHDVPALYGGVETEAYRHWQVHEQLVVDYLNTFERVDET